MVRPANWLYLGSSQSISQVYAIVIQPSFVIAGWRLEWLCCSTPKALSLADLKPKCDALPRVCCAGYQQERGECRQDYAFVRCLARVSGPSPNPRSASISHSFHSVNAFSFAFSAFASPSISSDAIFHNDIPSLHSFDHPFRSLLLKRLWMAPACWVPHRVT